MKHDDRSAAEAPEEQSPHVAGSRGGRPTGQLRERDRDRIFEIVGQGSQPGSEDDPHLGDERRTGADRCLKRVESGSLIGRGDAGGRVRLRSRVNHWMFLATRAPGTAPRGRCAGPASSCRPTEVPTPGCR